MEAERPFPEIRQVVLDCTDARALAEFYRQLLGLRYREGDEDPGQLEKDWLVLRGPNRNSGVAFQQVDELRQSTWPDPATPQQLHLDMTVRSFEDLEAQHERVLSLGGRLLYDRSDDPEEQLRVYADPAGHSFCIIVAPGKG
jgi:catechol 2,3-dioxygenase-like lactoylglutathione lyase family enzyme